MPRIHDARQERFGGYFDDYELGERFRHWPGKTITESEDHLFCLLTMAASPIHVDRVYGTKTAFGKNVVVGTYVYSLLLGMSVPDISGRAVANLGTQDLRHLAPVFHGDTLYGETEVVGLRRSASRPGEGNPHCPHRGVQSGQATGVSVYARSAPADAFRWGSVMPKAALEGVRVIELATVVAGPGAGRYLADFGAEVIKVEGPEGDPARRMGWIGPGETDSYFWKLLNRNKQAITLNLKTDEGKSRLWALLDDASVLIENMRPGKLEALGFSPEALLNRNPALVIFENHRLWSGRPIRPTSRLRHNRRGVERLLQSARRRERTAAAAANRAYRRGDGARWRILRDDRASTRRANG